MRLRSLLLSILIFVLSLFTVNVKATEYREEFRELINEASKPYTIYLRNQSQLHNFCLKYVNYFDFLYDYPSVNRGVYGYGKIPSSTIKEVARKTKTDEGDFTEIRIRFFAQLFKTTDNLVNYYGFDDKYFYFEKESPIGNTLDIFVTEGLKPTMTVSADLFGIGGYVFGNILDDTSSKLFIASFEDIDIDINNFTLAHTFYDASTNMCAIFATEAKASQ